MTHKFLPPASLEAKSKLTLRKLMIANNVKFGKEFDYFDFSYAQGKWHCWYKVSQKDVAELVLAGKVK